VHHNLLKNIGINTEETSLTEKSFSEKVAVITQQRFPFILVFFFCFFPHKKWKAASRAKSYRVILREINLETMSNQRQDDSKKHKKLKIETTAN